MVNRATARAVGEGASIADKWRAALGTRRRVGDGLPTPTRLEAPRVASIARIKVIIERKRALGIAAPFRVYATNAPSKQPRGDFGPFHCARFEAGDPYNGTVALSQAWTPIGDEWAAAVRGLD